MERGARLWQEALIYALAFGLALAVYAATDGAAGKSYKEPGAPYAGPRWSNDHHLEREYPPHAARGACSSHAFGVDAWGRPVGALEPRRAYGGALPPGGELDFNLRRMQIGKYEYDIGGVIPLEPEYAPPAPYPYRDSWRWDCLPDFK